MYYNIYKGAAAACIVSQPGTMWRRVWCPRLGCGWQECLWLVNGTEPGVDCALLCMVCHAVHCSAPGSTPRQTAPPEALSALLPGLQVCCSPSTGRHSPPQ